MLERRSDIVLTALQRLSPALWGKPRIAGLLRSWLEESQELEDAVFDMIAARFIENATGSTLRTLGRLVGQKDYGWSESDLRAAIRGRIRANRSDGTIVDVAAVIDLMIGAASPGAGYLITEQEIATIVVQFAGVLAVNEPALRDVLSAARGGGVKLDLLLPTNSITKVFTYRGAAQTNDPALGWNATPYTGTDGGAWLHVVRI